MKIQFQRLLKIDYNSLNNLNQFTFTNFLGERRMKTSITKIMLATSLMAFGVATSHAGDKFELSGQIRTRGEINAKDFNSDTDPNSYTYMRTRLNAKFMPLDHIDVLITIQDSRIWGTEGDLVNGPFKNTLNDNESLDLYQAFFNWKSINGSNFGLIAGRLGLSFANQRLVGTVGWHNSGRAFDGGAIYYTGENFTAHFVSAEVNETSNPIDLQTSEDIGDHVLEALHIDYKPTEGMSIQPFTYIQFINTDNGGTAGVETKTKVDYIGTSGAYFKYKMDNGFWIEADGAYQFGKTGAGATDVKANMFGSNIGMLTGDEDMKFGGKVGIDRLSGDKDGADTENNTFNTLYATNHKFYGHMDYYLANPANGLQDIFVGGIYKRENLGLTADFHIFSAIEGDNTDLGKELDLDFWWKINSAIKFNAGLGIYFPEAGDNGVWSYSGFSVNF